MNSVSSNEPVLASASSSGTPGQEFCLDEPGIDDDRLPDVQH